MEHTKDICLVDNVRSIQATTAKKEMDKGNNITAVSSENSINPENLLHELFSDVDERTMNVISRRYGLLDGEAETLASIGESYNVTRERIRQIQSKAIKRFGRKISSKRYEPTLLLIEENIRNHSHIITDEEADILVPEIIKSKKYDGSSVMNLLCDLGLYKTCNLKGFTYYTVKSDHLEPALLIPSVIKLLKRSSKPISMENLINEVKKNKKVNAKPEILSAVLIKVGETDPRIEQISNQYILSRSTTSRNIALITKILEDENIPLHFTEIASRVNDQLPKSLSLDVRRIHGILIESDCFSHTGQRGTYALTLWGFRKDSTLQIAKECILNAGFPVHFDYIYAYISKYKSSTRTSIKALLTQSGEFCEVSKNVYFVKQ
jgi:hypothetical protein